MKSVLGYLLLAFVALMVTALPLPPRYLMANHYSIARDDVSSIPDPEQRWDDKDEDDASNDDDIWGEKDSWHNDTDLWGQEHFAPDSTD